MPITLICPICRTPFQRQPYVLRTVRVPTCSPRCAAQVIRTRGAPTRDFEERFWSHVDRDTCLGATCGCHKGIGHCWPWMGCRNPRGYGRLMGNDKRLIVAHRAIYTYSHRLMLPAKIEVMHRCDVPPCVRLDHLLHGTHRENIKDAGDKGRRVFSKGVEHWKTHLVEEDILAIRALRGVYTQERIGKAWGLRQGQVSTIQLVVQWKEVHGSMSIEQALARFKSRVA